MLLQRYDNNLSCARGWREKLCKASAKAISLFNCFSEPQPILYKSEDLTGIFNSCWVFGDKNAAFTNQCGTTDERSMSREELAQSMPCKEEEDESQITNYIRECERMDVILHRHYGQVRGRTAKWMLAFTKLACMIWGISLLSHKF